MDVRIEMVTSDVHLITLITPELLEQIATQVAALLEEREEVAAIRRADTGIVPATGSRTGSGLRPRAAHWQARSRE